MTDVERPFYFTYDIVKNTKSLQVNVTMTNSSLERKCIETGPNSEAIFAEFFSRSPDRRVVDESVDFGLEGGPSDAFGVRVVQTGEKIQQKILVEAFEEPAIVDNSGIAKDVAILARVRLRVYTINFPCEYKSFDDARRASEIKLVYSEPSKPFRLPTESGLP